MARNVDQNYERSLFHLICSFSCRFLVLVGPVLGLPAALDDMDFMRIASRESVYNDLVPCVFWQNTRQTLIRWR